MTREKLADYFETLLDSDRFNDYGPNGLQIEGSYNIRRVAFSVSATVESVMGAVENNADTLVVHHGLFWKFHGPRTLTERFAKRIYPLVRNNLNLFAFHLPLDAHPVVGNAAALANKIGISERKPFGDYKGCPTGIQGKLNNPVSASQLRSSLASILDHEVILSTPDSHSTVNTAGIITGGANSDWVLAANEGLDAYITGEISEHDWHDAREAGVHMYAGGHHATERFGINALMESIRDTFDLECFFIDSENPA